MRECGKISGNIFLLDEDFDSDECGGKAENLSVLRSLGVNVPNAFVLSSKFFDAVAKETGLNVFIENALRELDGRNTAYVSEKIRNKIAETDFPERAVAEAYEFFDCAKFDKVAVRSSAVGEDGEHNAFAGMLDTFLGVQRKDLMTAVKKCFGSLYNERCIAYRAAKNLSQSSKTAVVIQEMIDSEYSGVVFSADPITGKDEFVIEYTEGVGESLVSGRITPDRIIVDRRNKTVSATRAVSYNKIAGAVEELCAETDRIKRYYKCDIDVEFAVANDMLYILQCRPITTLDNVHSLVFARERTFYVKRQFSWLFETFQKSAFDGDRQTRVLGFCLNTDNYLIANGSEYYDDQDHADDIARFDRYYASNGDFFGEYARRVFGIVDAVEQYTDRMKKEDFSRLSDSELAERLKDFENKYVDAIVPTFARPDDYLEAKIAALNEEKSLTAEQRAKILHAAAYYPERYAPLAYTAAISSMMSMAEKRLHGESIDAQLKEHVKKYSWMKGPLDARLKKFTKAEYIKDIEESARRPDRNPARYGNDDLRGAAREAKSILSAYPKLIGLFDALRDFVYLRTRLTETTDYMFYVFRTTLLKQIEKRVALKDGDIVLLSADEIADKLLNGTDVSRSISERREGYCLLKFGGKWLESFGADANNIVKRLDKIRKQRAKTDTGNNGRICGQVATRGYAVGKARIIKSHKDLLAVESGDIIVSSMTTPEYIFAIEKAAGFVTDEGGMTCHAAIISREFGIPCIVGTKIATEILENGQTVELDAFNGIVKFSDTPKKS